MASDGMLAGRVAVVTGGGSGIGRATAALLKQHGAEVHIADLRFEGDQPEGLIQHSCDVRSEEALQGLIDGVVGQHGRIDILINNAGIGMVKPITEVSEEDWSACMDTNLKAAFFGCKHAVKHMQQSGGGAIVNTASNAGLLPRSHDPVYSISKLALVGLTRSLALCHSQDRIRINAVCPGPVGETGMMNADLEKAEDREAAVRQFIAASPLARALDRMISPEEVAESILYLVSDASAMVTGTMIAIDGGKSLGVPPQPL